MSFGRARNHGCRISDDWTLKGMKTIILENELLRVTVLADRGSDIVEFRYKPEDLDFLYFAPGGIRNPAHETPSAYTDAPYLDFFSGGWNEILPNGGPLTIYKGARLGQHAEICLLPWEYSILNDSPERVEVKLWTRPIRTPFYIEKTLVMEPGKPALKISERVTNESGERLQFMWGQHIAFGRPFLEEGVVIDAPAKRFLVHDEMPNFGPRRFQPGAESDWPMAPTPQGGTADASKTPAFGAVQAQEMSYLADLQAGWYAITNPTRKVGFGIAFDPTVFRYIWYWQQLGNVADGYPWWSRTHTAALEPWSSYPTNGLEECIANGTALELQAGESLSAQLTAVAHAGFEHIRRVDLDGTVE
jgi:galactose mutarotase-like enzyme